MLNLPIASLVSPPDSIGSGGYQRRCNCRPELDRIYAGAGTLLAPSLRRRRRYFNFEAPGSAQGGVLSVDEIPAQNRDAIDEWQSCRHAFLLVNPIFDRGIGR